MSRAISVREYLTTDYSPDVEYVNGTLVDRHVGERDHARTVACLGSYLLNAGVAIRHSRYMSMRVRISRHHFRVADLCVIAGPEPEEQIFTTPPLLWIEILSSEDHMNDIQNKIDDLLGFGVRYVWLVDPRTKRAWIYTQDSIAEVRDGFLRTQDPDITVPMTEVVE